MKDQWGRVNNRIQAIQEFDLIDMAYFLTMIVSYPDRFPKNYCDWKEWLKKESGEDVECL